MRRSHVISDTSGAIKTIRYYSLISAEICLQCHLCMFVVRFLLHLSCAIDGSKSVLYWHSFRRIAAYLVFLLYADCISNTMTFYLKKNLHILQHHNTQRCVHYHVYVHVSLFNNQRYICILAIAITCLHKEHVFTLFESDKHFSHLSNLEREMAFRTEMVSEKHF